MTDIYPHVTLRTILSEDKWMEATGVVEDGEIVITNADGSDRDELKEAGLPIDAQVGMRIGPLSWSLMTRFANIVDGVVNKPPTQFELTWVFQPGMSLTVKGVPLYEGGILVDEAVFGGENLIYSPVYYESQAKITRAVEEGFVLSPDKFEEFNLFAEEIGRTVDYISEFSGS